MRRASSKNMKLTQVILCVLGFTVSNCIEIPAQAKDALRNAGIGTLNNVIGGLNTELTNAYNAYKSANSSCNGIIQTEITRCSSCVRTKCENRAKSVCEPDGWEKVLAAGVEIVKSVPDVLINKLPKTVLKVAPNKLIEAAKDVHGFLKEKVVDKVVDTVKDVGDKIVDTAKDVGDKVVDTVKDVGKKIGGGIRRVFRGWGKRRLGGTQALRLRRNAEPSCDALKNDAGQACQVYVNAAHCPNCGFNPMTGCPGFSSVVNRLQRAQDARKWLDKATNQQFEIVSFSYDGAFLNARARVLLFGKDFTIQLGTLNPYDVNRAGVVVANKALDRFKAL